MKQIVARFALDESGAATVEYAILLAVIAAVCIVMVGSIGNAISKALENVESGF